MTESNEYVIKYIGEMMLNATFNNISDIVEVTFIGWRKTEYLLKTTDLPQVTDKLYHIIIYTCIRL